MRKAATALAPPKTAIIQRIDDGDGREIPLISNPIQFDRTPPALGRAPGFGGDTDEILLSLGWGWDRILEAKASGAAF